nr:hypothetical protein [Hassalia byssoidea]
MTMYYPNGCPWTEPGQKWTGFSFGDAKREHLSDSLGVEDL